MSTSNLASGPVTSTERLTVEMVTPSDAPPAILVYWPGCPAPSAYSPPHRFAPAALAVIAVLDQALIAYYSQVEESGQ